MGKDSRRSMPLSISSFIAFSSFRTASGACDAMRVGKTHGCHVSTLPQPPDSRRVAAALLPPPVPVLPACLPQ